MRVNHLNNNLIKIDKSEVLRYLAYKSKDIDEETDILLNESIAELKEITELKYVYRIFDIAEHNNIISFENQINIKSNDLTELLKNCKRSAVMAATLGFEVEKRIKYYSMANLSKAVIFDACAASCIEYLCDLAEAEIKELAIKDGCNITFRYSPGYGDVPISHQNDILTALNAQKLIGLSVTDSFILIPRKSVTAFIGFSMSDETTKKSCLNCNLFGNCDFQGKENNCVR
ncbi:methionine synthase [Sedimentibacter hydroxybenzoicus DSM 7310]|uniref:Methionine synthase n=1 Tax=Sedimentibacter hydroxybenzoicus DSM 7310 TaxID=1123245 RepID=A0A974BKX5_SEDHY|nr:vitamin B12 dependent-methionine synthase activation domain-containing protein [Sedimentibacter hydroxybenzoicus]NYB74756.1 methionine synthase [Sedimentibacter hydroxybenzoicus DSM 7310]